MTVLRTCSCLKDVLHYLSIYLSIYLSVCLYISFYLSICQQNSIYFIKNDNIKAEQCLNRSGWHLNWKGSSAL